MSARTKNESFKWSIGDFYHRAWDLTWKNKKLWILGLAVSIYAAGGGSGGGNSFSSNDFQNFQENQQEQQELPESPYSDLIDEAGVQEQVDEVMEAVDPEIVLQQKSDLVTDVMKPFIEGFQEVPGPVLALLVIEGFLFFIGMIILSFFLSAWSMGALIQGVADAATEKKIDLFKISSHSLTRVKSMVWLMIVPGLKFFLTVLLIAVVGALGIAFLTEAVPATSIVAALAGIAAIVWFVYALARLLVSLIYASRYAVLESLSGSESYAAGYALAKGTILKTIRLGAANVFVALVVTMAAMMPLVGVGFVTVVRDLMREVLTVWSFVPVAITFMVAMPIMFLIGGIVKVFVFSTWHFAFTALKGMKTE